MISFNVKNQTLTLVSPIKVVADSQDYLLAAFTFTEDWKNTVKIAQFSRNGITYREILDEHDVAKVPWEVLRGKGRFAVTVTGNNAQNEPNLVITTNPLIIKVWESGLINGEVFHESTQGVEGGVLHQINAKAEEAATSASNAHISEENAAESLRQATLKANAASDSAAEAERQKGLAQGEKEAASQHANDAAGSARQAAESAATATALAEHFAEIVNAPHYYYDENGHLMFSYGTFTE